LGLQATPLVQYPEKGHQNTPIIPANLVQSPFPITDCTTRIPFNACLQTKQFGQTFLS
jgi:hypothetical protein